MKKILKVTGIILLTLILLITLGLFIVSEPKPTGTTGVEVEQLTDSLFSALNKEAYDTLEIISWSFPRGHHFVWDKKNNRVNVKWGDYEVDFSPEDKSGQAFLNGKKLESDQKREAIEDAWALFANDSFWLVAPFKLRDPGTTRELINTEDGQGILVTYSSGGVTPGDSYLWVLDENFKPVYWKLWVKIIPAGGVKFTWENWQSYSGVWLSTYHTGPGGYGMELKNVSVK